MTAPAKEVVCRPGTERCSGQNLEVCTPQGAGWLTIESCMEQCQDAACIGPSCLPLELTASPAQLPADESSSTLISSAPILSHNGSTVPDGSLFTVSTTGGVLLAQDGDPNTPGVQVRSLNGRIDFAVQAPAMGQTTRCRSPSPCAPRTRWLSAALGLADHLCGAQYGALHRARLYLGHSQ